MHRQPHWTLLCIPADDTDEATGKVGASPTPQELLGPSAADIDLSQAHLQLCLSLELPLVIAITKYDLATKAGLRQTLSKLLSILKEAGRKPCIIHDSTTPASEADMHDVSTNDLQEAEPTVRTLTNSPLAVVPIILTSAVKGTGINKLHAFLRQLPLSVLPQDTGAPCPTQLFHIEDVYSVQSRTSSDGSAIVGGYLRHGTLNVGDELLLGPYPVDTSSDDSDSGSSRPPRTTSMPQSRSFPGALSRTHTGCASIRDRHSEWRRVRISSLRNLRLPVRTLHADQVGTMGIMPIDAPILSPSINRIRKGMVLLNRHPKASKIITVRFEGAQALGVHKISIGSAVVLYVASVRASCKVISVSEESSTQEPNKTQREDEDEDDAFGFGFDTEEDSTLQPPTLANVMVTFQFSASKEFVEVGAKTLVMPGGGTGQLSGGGERGTKGIAGLEGFVGRVVEQV